MALMAPDESSRPARRLRRLTVAEEVPIDAVDVAALGQRFLAGDPAALREAYNRWSGLVMALARRSLAGGHDVEDAVQETFVAAWRTRASFDPDRAPLPAWLTGIARNKVKDRLRDLHRAPTPVDPDGQRPAASSNRLDDVDRVAEVLLVRDALDSLTEQQRQVLELSFFGGHPHGDIAELLDMPIGTVKSHARRGLQALQRHLGAHDG